MSEGGGGAPRTLRGAVEAVGGRWPSSAASALAEDDLEHVARALGGLVVHDAPSFALGTASLCHAVLDGDGRVRSADAAFRALFAADDPSRGLKRLIGQAERDGTAVGLVDDGSDGPVAVCVATAEAGANWPLSPALRAGIADERRWIAMAFDPMRQRVATAAAGTFGLSRLETRVAFMMLEVPTIGVAAERLAIGSIVARNALGTARRKLGVRSTTALIRRLTDFACNLTRTDEVESFAAAMDVTPAEARVAQLTAQGLTAGEAASALGVSSATVRTHVSAIFGKLGIGRAKDLGRISAELIALSKMTRAGEIVPPAAGEAAPLRIVARADGRHVAFLDYGPRHGRPLLFCHALASGRTLPPGLPAMLHAAGYRSIVPQRPGYGLTDQDGGDYLATAADDMAAVLDALRVERTDLFARDVAAAPALAFAARFPARIGHGLLLNPQAPANPHRHRSPLSIAAGVMQRHPEIVRPLFEVLRRQLSGDRAVSLLRASFRGGVESDAAALDDPALLHWLTADMQAMVARSAIGPVRERLVYADGWRPPAEGTGGRWTVACCAQLGDRDWTGWWEHLPGVRFCSVPRGGLLLPATHPDVLVALLADRQEAKTDACRPLGRG